MGFAEIADSFFKPAVRDLVPYEPGKPVEEVQRELGLDRVVKLASNEGPFGPFPEALEALARGAEELNRYPDGGSYRLRAALAERHDVRFEEVAPGAGSDGIVDYLSQLALDPGDEIVCGWPSFPSYVIDALKLGAVPDQGAAAGAPLRPRGDARGGRAADEDRLRLPSEQPDRDDEHASRARRLLRRGSRARADGPRPGLLRVHRRSGLRGRARVRARPAAGQSSCGRSRRSTGSPGCVSATRSARPSS